MIKTYGFLNSDLADVYGLTREQLITIINGAPYDDEKSDNYKVLEAFRKYVNDMDNYSNYRKELQDTLKSGSSNNKTKVEDCTPEELRRLIAETNERLANGR